MPLVLGFRVAVHKVKSGVNSHFCGHFAFMIILIIFVHSDSRGHCNKVKRSNGTVNYSTVNYSHDLSAHLAPLERCTLLGRPFCGCLNTYY
jgi:hypothetical protein